MCLPIKSSDYWPRVKQGISVFKRLYALIQSPKKKINCFELNHTLAFEACIKNEEKNSDVLVKLTGEDFSYLMRFPFSVRTARPYHYRTSHVANEIGFFKGFLQKKYCQLSVTDLAG